MVVAAVAVVVAVAAAARRVAAVTGGQTKPQRSSKIALFYCEQIGSRLDRGTGQRVHTDSDTNDLSGLPRVPSYTRFSRASASP